jgi:hypothetical protein
MHAGTPGLHRQVGHSDVPAGLWNDTYKGHRGQVDQRRKEAEKLQKQIDKECCGK